jgi:hypothetical protein
MIGRVHVQDGVVTRIVKDYQVSDPYGLIDVYTVAMKDLLKRGGSTCITQPQMMNDNRYWGTTTVCGPYELTAYLPGRLERSSSPDNRMTESSALQRHDGRRNDHCHTFDGHAANEQLPLMA